MEPNVPPGAPRSEPAVNIPGIVLATIGLLCLVYVAQWGLGPEREAELASVLAFVPARVSIGLGWVTLQEVISAARAATTATDWPLAREAIRFFVWEQGPAWHSLVTHALLHGGPLHLAMNCLWLAVFGSPLARRLGAGGFLLLLTLGAAAGAFAHLVSRPLDYAPMLGASGAVSAATGAAARFVFSLPFRPNSLSDDMTVRALPALSLAGMMRNRQAVIFVAFWFLTNWLFGAGHIPIAGVDQAVAWQAHVGGFLGGLLLFPLMDRRGMKMRD